MRIGCARPSSALFGAPESVGTRAIFFSGDIHIRCSFADSVADDTGSPRHRLGQGASSSHPVSSPPTLQEPRPRSCPRRRECHGLHRGGGCNPAAITLPGAAHGSISSAVTFANRAERPGMSLPDLVSMWPRACQERRFSQLLNSTDTTERDAGMLLLLRPPPAPPG